MQVFGVLKFVLYVVITVSEVSKIPFDYYQRHD
jgi:hypothetical protein